MNTMTTTVVGGKSCKRAGKTTLRKADKFKPLPVPMDVEVDVAHHEAMAARDRKLDEKAVKAVRAAVRPFLRALKEAASAPHNLISIAAVGLIDASHSFLSVMEQATWD